MLLSVGLHSLHSLFEFLKLKLSLLAFELELVSLGLEAMHFVLKTPCRLELSLFVSEGLGKLFLVILNDSCLLSLQVLHPFLELLLLVQLSVLEDLGSSYRIFYSLDLNWQFLYSVIQGDIGQTILPHCLRQVSRCLYHVLAYDSFEFG